MACARISANTRTPIADLELVDYKVRILNGGTEAMTRVLIEFGDSSGERWTTIGVSDQHHRRLVRGADGFDPVQIAEGENGLSDPPGLSQQQLAVVPAARASCTGGQGTSP